MANKWYIAGVTCNVHDTTLAFEMCIHTHELALSYFYYREARLGKYRQLVEPLLNKDVHT